MPIQIKHLAVKAPVLSEGQIAEAKRDFVAETRRELIVFGEDPNDPHVASVLAEMPGKLSVTSTTLGPVARYVWKHGGPVGAEQAATEIIEAARARAALASFGPDPRDQAVTRLVASGLTKAEATELVGRRLERKPDGHVVAYKLDGSVLHSGPSSVPGRQYAPEEMARFADANDAVTAVVRAILAERETRSNPRPNRSINVGGAF